MSKNQRGLYPARGRLDFRNGLPSLKLKTVIFAFVRAPGRGWDPWEGWESWDLGLPQALTRFSFHPSSFILHNSNVGVTGFEPVTLRLSSACSNQLSYTPVRLGLALFCAPASRSPVSGCGGMGSRTPDL
jgi:hypothetical protein